MHIYLNWKNKAEAELAQCSNGLRPTIYILVSRQIILIHQSGKLSKHLELLSVHFFLCTQLARYALNPQFSGCTSRICAKTLEPESILGVVFVNFLFTPRFF